MADKADKKRRPFADQDAKGNYDIDGVSYDGDQVIIGSEEPENLKTDPTSSTDSEKLDRQKNLDSQEGTVAR